MKIEKASVDDIVAVAMAMRERDFDEFRAVNFVETRQDLAAALAFKCMTCAEDVLCASAGDAPIAIGGFILSRPNVISLMFFATDAFPTIALGLTRFVRREMIPRYTKAGVHRFEALSIDGHRQAQKWLRALGLEPESGPLRGFGKNGESFLQFSRVVDVGSSCTRH